MTSFTIFTKPPKGFQPTPQICLVSKTIAPIEVIAGEEWKGDAPEAPNSCMCQLWIGRGSKPVWVVLPTVTADELVFVEPKETNIIAAVGLPVHLKRN